MFIFRTIQFLFVKIVLLVNNYSCSIISSVTIIVSNSMIATRSIVSIVSYVSNINKGIIVSNVTTL